MGRTSPAAGWGRAPRSRGARAAATGLCRLQPPSQLHEQLLHKLGCTGNCWDVATTTKRSEACFKRTTQCPGCSDVDITCCNTPSAFPPHGRGQQLGSVLCHFWKAAGLRLGKLRPCGSQGVFAPRIRFQRNWRTELQSTMKLKIKTRHHPLGSVTSGWRIRAHSNSLGTRPQLTATKKSSRRHLLPAELSLPASPHHKLKLCWLKSISEAWF